MENCDFACSIKGKEHELMNDLNEGIQYLWSVANAPGNTGNWEGRLNYERNS